MVNDPFGRVNLPYQIPVISCAQRKDGNNSPSNNPIMVMKWKFEYFIIKSFWFGEDSFLLVNIHKKLLNMVLVE